jgi:hypothetical protein
LRLALHDANRLALSFAQPLPGILSESFRVGDAANAVRVGGEFGRQRHVVEPTACAVTRDLRLRMHRGEHRGDAQRDRSELSGAFLHGGFLLFEGLRYSPVLLMLKGPNVKVLNTGNLAKRLPQRRLHL